MLGQTYSLVDSLLWYHVPSDVALVILLQWYNVTSDIALADFLLWYNVISDLAPCHLTTVESCCIRRSVAVDHLLLLYHAMSGAPFVN